MEYKTVDELTGYEWGLMHIWNVYRHIRDYKNYHSIRFSCVPLPQLNCILNAVWYTVDYLISSVWINVMHRIDHWFNTALENIPFSSCKTSC